MVVAMSIDVLSKMRRVIVDPTRFFTDVRAEDWRPSFRFFLAVVLVIAIVTPLLNVVGMESNDFSSSCQSQIAAYAFMKTYWLDSYGLFAYLLEGVAIVAFSLSMLLLLTVLVHGVYRLIGGKGSLLHGWKSVYYGLGPCLLGGFLPYVALFAAFYSFALQFYVGPKILYSVKEDRAIVVFTSFIALAFIEMFVVGTTVGKQVESSL
jgi:hypothetical protein